VGLFDDFKAAVSEMVELVVDGVRDAAQAAPDQTRQVAEDFKDEVRYGLEAAAPHVRRGIGVAAFAAGWVARETAAMFAEMKPAPEEEEAGEEWKAEAPGANEVELPPYEERPLTEAEEVWARQVFRESLPYDLVHLSNQLGLHGRPYAVPHPTTLGAFVVHAGPDVYADPTGAAGRVGGQRGDAVFIQQLVHVWQGVHPSRTLDYAVRALVSAFLSGDDAYRYEPGKAWAEYDAEQQSAIVRDWYLSGMPPGGALFPYVRDHIWTGTP
jgi:hypothetical protein